MKRRDVSPHCATVRARVQRLADGPLGTRQLLKLAHQLQVYGQYVAAEVHRQAVCERLIRKEVDVGKDQIDQA